MLDSWCPTFCCERFRNDLCLHDHEPLAAACAGATSLLPVYIFDPSEYGKVSMTLVLVAAVWHVIFCMCVALLLLWLVTRCVAAVVAVLPVLPVTKGVWLRCCFVSGKWLVWLQLLYEYVLSCVAAACWPCLVTHSQRSQRST